MLQQKTLPVVIQVSRIKESFQNRCFSDLNGISVLDCLINRLKKEYNSQIIIATSDRTEDKVFDEVAKSQEIEICHGDYGKLVERLLKTVEKIEAKHFIRVYANYPLLDVEEMKRLAKKHIEGEYEYSYNEHNEGALWGTGCEVFSKTLLYKLLEQDLEESQQGTVGFYIRQHAHHYKVLKNFVTKNRPGYKLCLENHRDLQVIRELYENIPKVNNCEIINYLSKHKVLSQYNLLEPPKEVGTEKLFLHSEKVKKLLEKDSFDNSYPISVELSLTNQCNLKCVYCSDLELRNHQGFTSKMDIKKLKTLFDDLKEGGTKGVVIEGGGEPTLYAEFEEVVLYARKIGLAVGLITNGTRKLEEELLQQFEWIRVSLDATTGEEYQNLKGIDRFELVLSNIAEYAKYCNTVGVGFVVTKKNISQLETLVLRLRELRVSYIQLRPVVDCEELYPYGIDLGYLKCYETPKYAIEIGGMQENASSGNAMLPCKAHSLTTVISAEGSVYLCGRLNIYDWIPPIGNINLNSFYEIWNSTERKEQVEMVSNKQFCAKNCPQCRISKFNQLLDRLDRVQSKHFI